jgi:hypothetical protein
VRELGSDLVLDHFSHITVQPERMPLMSALDNAHADHYIALLDKPSATRSLVFGPEDGNLVELDRRLLEEFDESLLAAAPLGGGYEVARETREEPTPFVDHIAIQVLRMKARLSVEGRDWANVLSEDLLSPTLDELAIEESTLVFAPARGGATLPFVLRGTPTNALLVHGLHRMPEFMRQVEMSHPNTVQGKASAWEFRMPTDDLAAIAGVDAPATGLRGSFVERSYVIEGQFDATREHLEVEVYPR